MDRVDPEDATRNVPHMHLFVDLKQKFPELKDAEITDCIHKFGFVQETCEAELNRRMVEQQRGYYSPWNQSRSSSRPPSVTRTPLAERPNNGLYPPDASPETLNRRPNVLPLQSFAQPASSGSRPVYSFAANTNLSTTSSQHPSPLINKNIVVTASDNSRLTANVNSAPVISADLDPFSYHTPSSRRSSAETQMERRGRLSPNVVVIQEQLTRKEKLEDELKRRLDEKQRLKEEVKTLSDELESKENYQKLDVDRSKKRIENIQNENSNLKILCDRMKREIISSGESVRAESEQRRTPNRVSVPSPATSPHDQSSSHNPPIPFSPSSSHSSCTESPSTPVAPPRRPVIGPQVARHSEPPRLNEDGGRSWSCSKCTFINSPFLNECEMCAFPHFSGTPPSAAASHGTPNAGEQCYCRIHRPQFDQQNSVRDI